MLEAGVLLAFAAMLCWGVGDFLIQRSVRKFGDVQTLAFIGIVGAVGLLPFIAADFGRLTSEGIAFLAGIGAITFIVAILNFEALKQGKLSVVEVILEMELPVTVVLGIIFLGEILTIPQLLAILAVFAGIILMAAGSLSIGHMLKNMERGALIAGAAAIGMGIVNFLTGVGSKDISPLMAIWVPWIGFTALCFAYMIRKNLLRDFFGNAAKNWQLAGLTGAFDTMAWLFFALAVTGSQISITIGITESYPAIAIALGCYFNREAIATHQAAGAMIAVGSSVALALI